MKVVVGLGNPGPRYERTRHNLGFRVLAVLAARHSAPKVKLRFEAELAEITIAGEKTLLVAPQTFMNLSGRSVRKVVDFYNLDLSDLMVVCDDMNLETGRLRLRRAGSAGGQKGLQDIIDRLGSEQFARLRIGIDRPQESDDAAQYVLRKFRAGELDAVEQAVLRAADGVEQWVRDGVEPAMNGINAPQTQ